MYMILDRSSVQNVPVLIMSHRLAARPGIMVVTPSIRMYSGVRPSRFAISLPSSGRRPISSPLSFAYCRGGSVGLIDMTKDPALIIVGGATFGWAKLGVGRTPATAVAPARISHSRRLAPRMRKSLFLPIVRSLLDSDARPWAPLWPRGGACLLASQIQYQQRRAG